MNTDSVNIPVTSTADVKFAEAFTKELAKELAKLKAQLTAEAEAFAIKAAEGSFPVSRPTVSGKQQFDIGGRKFEIAGKAAVTKEPQPIPGEDDVVSYANAIQFSASIKEITDKVRNDMDASVQRLKKFKEAIKYQPLEVKQSSITKFIAEFGDINNELTERLGKIGNILKRKGFTELQESIKNFDPEKQIEAIDKYLENNNAAIEKLNDQKSKIEGKTKGLSPQEIEQLQPLLPALNEEIKNRNAAIRKANNFKSQAQDKMKGINFQDFKQEAALLPLEKRNEVWGRYIAQDGAFIARATEQIVKNNEKLRSRDFKRNTLAAKQLPLEQREAFYRNLLKQDDSFRAEYEELIRKDNETLKGRRFKSLKREAKKIPLDQREKFYQEQLKKSDEFREDIDEFIRVDNQKLKATGFSKLKTRIKSFPLEEQNKLYEDELRKSQEFKDEIENEMRKNTQRMKATGFRKIKSQALQKPLEEREQFYQDVLARDQTFKDEINQQIEKDKKSLQQKGFRSVRSEARDLPLEQREAFYRDYLTRDDKFRKQIEAQILRDNEKLKTRKFKQAKDISAGLLLDDREAFWTQFGLQNQELAVEASREMDKAKQQLQKRTFKRAKTTASRLPLDQQEGYWNALAAIDAEMRENADKEIAKLRRPIASDKMQKFQTEKSRISQLPLQDQFQAWETYKSSIDALVTRANKEQGKLGQAFVRNTRAAQKTRFTDWSKRLQGMDPAAAIREIDTFLGDTTTAMYRRFNQDARLMRDRFRKASESANRQMQKDRQRQFANTVMGAAGAGLGILGPAGFPLLNIGFAAMSGGPVMTGIVALATAIGETTRVLGEYKQATIDAARALHFVANATTNTEARTQAFDAAIASATMSAQQIGEQTRLDIRKKRIGEISDSQENRTEWWEAIKTQLSLAWNEGLFKGDPYWETLRKQQVANTPELRIKRMDQALNNALNQLMKPSVGIETDPYEVWKRMQTAALDPSKAQELEAQQAQIKALRENTKALKDKAKQEIEDKRSSGFMSGFMRGLGSGGLGYYE